MKRITLLFLLFTTQLIFAQFTTGDVKFHVGTGTETAYLVVDFKDGTDDRSYAWGYHFNLSDNKTVADLIAEIGANEPNFTFATGFGGGFLNDIVFNQHSGLGGSPDYWSTWEGASADTFGMNGGISTKLQNSGWYGVSYGFSNPTAEAPATPIAAYSSKWYKEADITTWLGTGTNKSLVVVDFGTDTNGVPDSYVFGIQYNGSLTGDEALDLIDQELNGFSYVMNTSDIASVTVGQRTETAGTSDKWKIYKGKDLSSWKTQADVSQVTLGNGEWLGLSIGKRRPFKPQEITASLSSSEVRNIEFNIYPNPVSDVLNIQTAQQIDKVVIYNMQGRVVLQSKAVSSVNVSSLNSGIYLLEIHTPKGTSAVRFVRK